MSASAITSLLLIEDNPGDARLLREMFIEHGSHETTMTHVESMTDGERHLAEHAVDLILLDLGLVDAEGLDAVRRAHAAAPRIPLVVLTGRDDETLAAQALQAGAQDYLIKGQIDPRGLIRSLRYAIERNFLEEALFAEKERAQVTLDCIGDAVVCTDLSGRITFLNIAAQTIAGWSMAEARGHPMGDVFQILDASSRAPVLSSSSGVGRTRNVRLPSNCVLIQRDGFEIAIEDTIAPIHDSNGRPIGEVVVFHDVTAAREMTQEITHSAHHDFLTGLPNRLLLNDRISQAIALAPRHHNQVAVMFLDLDGFKHINDSLGHPVGDRLLQSVAERLVGCVRASDTVSRQGGDEFVILLSEVERSQDAAISARRMLEAVAESHTVDKQELHITTSIGVSIFPDDGLDAETLIKNADTAMYQAKENGRQGYRFFKPAMNVRAVERQSIEESLRRALKRDEFALHYQPKIDLRTGKITGAEALIRWHHPERGLVPPTDFIPVAEDCGLIIPIGNWVLAEACRQARAWLDAGLPVTTMAVNVSALEFNDDDFLDGVLTILEGTGLDPSLLELELTESVLMKRVDSTATTLHSLRERGVKVAVDDFGTGYSSLSYLRKFPIDSLKIDQSFIRQISAKGDDTTIVTAVIDMARSLKLRVIAEGVETVEELTFLQAHQCDEAQGFYFSRPVPPEQFAELLKSGISERMFRQSIIERQTILETQFRWVHELLERSGPLDVEDEDDEAHAALRGNGLASPSPHGTDVAAHHRSGVGRGGLEPPTDGL